MIRAIPTSTSLEGSGTVEGTVKYQPTTVLPDIAITLVSSAPGPANVEYVVPLYTNP